MSTFSIVTGRKQGRKKAHGRIHFAPSLPGLQLRVNYEFLNGVHARGRNLRRFEARDDFGGSQFVKHFVHRSIQLRTILDPLGIRVKARVGGNLGELQHQSQNRFHSRSF